MITRERYKELVEKAIEKYNRYIGMYPQGASIVYIASPSVIDAIHAYNDICEGLLYETYMEPRSMGLYGRIRGVDIYFVRCNDDIFSPALVWNSTEEIHLAGNALENGDYLIDENALYTYDAGQNAYIETGLTIDSRIYAEQLSVGNIYADRISAGNLYSETSMSTISDAITSFTNAASTFSATIDTVDYSAIFDNLVGGRKSKKAKAERELNPGDTKAIDDYLNSFARQQTLREA